jgi:hypothetical protein
MRSTLRLVCVAAAAVLALPGAARAQTRRPAAPSPIGLRAYAIVDLDAVAATQSFNAVLGTSQLPAFGGGVEVVDIWKHLFARVAVTRARKTGSRVFVSGSDVFPLGIPLTITMTPVEAGLGWRVPLKSKSKSVSRITPYVGAAFVSMGYTETSTFGDPADNTSARFKGEDVFGGLEIGLAKWLTASGEAQYRRVPNALSAGGVSKDFGENDLGGFTARITIGVRTKR